MDWHRIYDAYTGQPTYTNTKKLGVTSDGHVLTYSVVYIDLGRPDRIPPVPDPDIELGRERLPRVTIPTMHRNGATLAGARKKAAMRAKVEGYLREHGPTQSNDLARAIGVIRGTLLAHLWSLDNTVYRRVGMVGKNVVWGLI